MKNVQKKCLRVRRHGTISAALENRSVIPKDEVKGILNRMCGRGVRGYTPEFRAQNPGLQGFQFSSNLIIILSVPRYT